MQPRPSIVGTESLSVIYVTKEMRGVALGFYRFSKMYNNKSLYYQRVALFYSGIDPFGIYSLMGYVSL